MTENKADSKPRRRSSLMGKFWLLVGVIVLLAAGLCGAWYYGASRLEQEIASLKQRLTDDGVAADCEGQEIRGFPFRLGVFCNTFFYADPVNGVTVSGNAIRSAAQLYRPGHVVSETDGPLKVSAPGLVPLLLDWEKLRSSVRVSLSGLRRSSLVAENIRVSADDLGLVDLLGTMQALQLHLLAGDENGNHAPQDLVASADIKRWQIDDGGAGLIEPVDFSLLVTVRDGLAMAMSGQDPLAILRSRGGEAELAGIEFSTAGGGRLRASGPLQLGRNGKLSGELELDLDDPQKLVDYAASVFPPAREMLGDVSSYLEAFSASTGGKAKIRGLKLTLRDNKVLLGFIELAELPRFY